MLPSRKPVTPIIVVIVIRVLRLVVVVPVVQTFADQSFQSGKLYRFSWRHERLEPPRDGFPCRHASHRKAVIDRGSSTNRRGGTHGFSCAGPDGVNQLGFDRQLARAGGVTETSRAATWLC